MITRLTGKHQVTVPAEIVDKAGLRNGSRLDWRMTEREGVLEVHVLPDKSALAAGLRGRGNRFRRSDGSPVERLLQERDQDEETGSGG